MELIINFLKSLYNFLAICLFRLAKCFLRKTTHLTELQRIVYGELRGYRRIRFVELSLEKSRNPDVGQQLAELALGVNDGRFHMKGTRQSLMVQASVGISKAKGINLKSHSRFVNGLCECLEIIYAYKCLNMRLELLRSTAYNSNDSDHERKLMQLWDNLKSPEVLSGRKSRQWQDVGFQGNDPATDFRGAGLLALESLLYFTQTYPEMSKIMLANSQHPLYSYPLALLSIQITYFAYELFRNGNAKSHFYNRVGSVMTLDWKAGPTDKAKWGEELLNVFYEFCCSLIIDFDGYWLSCKPKDIMEYGRIKSEFDNKIKKKLCHDEACFLMDVRTI